ncbi:MAG: DNA polymerase III subunit delta' [Bosea sp. (in: a-proteobacteria)]
MSETEPDKLDGALHPRDTAVLLGHDAPEAAVLAAINGGKLHHAWLLSGLEGIGKATFAYRLARRLLMGLKPGETLTSLDVLPDHPVARQIAAQSHPDIAIIRRGFQKDGKTLSRTIAVENVRRAVDMFGSTAAAGGWRICIVDCADEMNINAANALLKMLEEPPPRGLFLLISHRPGRLLPTIRSRCRRLDFAPLSRAHVEAAMRAAGGVGTDQDFARAASLSGGSVMAGLQRLDPEILALIEQVRGLLAALPMLDLKAVMALSEEVNGKAGEEALHLVLDTIELWASEELRRHAGKGAGQIRPMLDAFDAGRRALYDALTYNIDRRPALIGLFQDMAAARRTRAG